MEFGPQGETVVQWVSIVTETGTAEHSRLLTWLAAGTLPSSQPQPQLLLLNRAADPPLQGSLLIIRWILLDTFFSHLHHPFSSVLAPVVPQPSAMCTQSASRLSGLLVQVSRLGPRPLC